MAYLHDKRRKTAASAVTKAMGTAQLSPAEVTPLSHPSRLNRRARELRAEADKIGMQNPALRDSYLKLAERTQAQADASSGVADYRRVQSLQKAASLRAQADKIGMSNPDLRDVYLNAAQQIEDEDGNR